VTPKPASAGCDRALRPGNGPIVDCRGVIPRRDRPAADFNGRGDRQEKKISESGPSRWCRFRRRCDAPIYQLAFEYP
jgi:hypothetical protein